MRVNTGCLFAVSMPVSGVILLAVGSAIPSGKGVKALGAALIALSLIGLLVYILRSMFVEPEELPHRDSVVEIGGLFVDSGSIAVTDDPDLTRNIMTVPSVPAGEYTVRAHRRTFSNGNTEYTELVLSNGDARGGKKTPFAELVVDSCTIVLCCLSVIEDKPAQERLRTAVRECTADAEPWAFIEDSAGVRKGLFFIPTYGDNAYPLMAVRKAEGFELHCLLDVETQEEWMAQL
jgi:hypothetical protein